VTFPDGSIVRRGNPAVLATSVFATAAENPVVVLPVKLSDGAAAVPAGSCKAPVMVSPIFATFPDAVPVKAPVIVPAEKLPEASRLTIVLGVLALVAALAAVVAEATLAAVCPPTVDTTVTP